MSDERLIWFTDALYMRIYYLTSQKCYAVVVVIYFRFHFLHAYSEYM